MNYGATESKTETESTSTNNSSSLPQEISLSKTENNKKTMTNNDETENLLLSRREREFESIENGDFRYIVPDAEETKRKAVRALVPTLFFLILMSSISYIIIRNTNYLYSSNKRTQGGIDHSRNRYDDSNRIHTGTNTRGGVPDGANSAATTGASDVEEDENTNNSVPDAVSADCAYHSQCDLIGLAGQCCPTKSGVNLACC